MRPHQHVNPDDNDRTAGRPLMQAGPGGAAFDDDLDLSDTDLAAYGLPGRSARAVPTPRGATDRHALRSSQAPVREPQAPPFAADPAARQDGHAGGAGLQGQPTAEGDDDRDAQLLLATARRHIGGAACPQAVNCLSAAADALTDPQHPPVLSNITEGETTDLGAVAAAVRARMLDPDRPGSVGQVLARGYAARELTDALRHLTRPVPAAANAAARGQALRLVRAAPAQTSIDRGPGVETGSRAPGMRRSDMDGQS